VKASAEDSASGGAAPTTNAAGTGQGGDKIAKQTPPSRAPNSTSSTAAGESGAGVPTFAHTATTAGNYLGQKLKAAQVEGLGAGNDLHSDVR